jgi:hypothetical protein
MKKRDIPEKTCAFCEMGTRMIDEESVLCKKRGPVSSDYTCRKFVFDPLKETPCPSSSIKKMKMETL